MRARHALTVSVAFNAGVLVTLACSQGGDAVSAVAETVAAGVRAIDVTFDDSVARLTVTTVQGGIDALDERVDGLDGSTAALAERLATAEATMADVSKQLEALKELPKLQASVDALTTQNAALQQIVDEQKAALGAHDVQLLALAAADTSMTSCPPDTYRVGTTCIEANARNETLFDAAAKVCGKLGGRLCFPSEFSSSCELSLGINTNGASEFTAIVADSGPRLANTVFNQCVTVNDPVQQPGDPGGYPFRCCYDRINLAGPPPAPTP